LNKRDNEYKEIKKLLKVIYTEMVYEFKEIILDKIKTRL
jgi:hypothetical protein